MFFFLHWETAASTFALNEAGEQKKQEFSNALQPMVLALKYCIFPISHSVDFFLPFSI